MELKKMVVVPRDMDGVGGLDNAAFHADKPTTQIADASESGNGHHDVKNKIDVIEDDDDRDCQDPVGRLIYKLQHSLIDAWTAHRAVAIRVVQCILLVLYFTYFGYAMYHRFGDEGSVRLLLGTILGVLIVSVNLTSGHISSVASRCYSAIIRGNDKQFRKIIRWSLYLLSTVTMVTLLIVLVAVRTPGNLVSLAGLAAFVILAYVTSIHPAKVNWHPVFWGISLQFYFAVIILRTEWGFNAFKWLGDRMSEFLQHSQEGAVFVFGDKFSVHFFAFAIMPMVVFFSSVTSVLYYLGVLQAIVNVIGRFLAACLGTTPAESLVAAANIFMGMTDSPLLVRPFVPKMTKSELHAVMTGGFATIAGSVFGAYIGFGVPANHLLAASVMSAPAALAISKITYPETEKRQISNEEYGKMEKAEERNVLEAASAGATWSITLVGYILANIIAFLSILKFVNQTLNWFGERAGVAGLSFELICSYVLYPVALFMGTEPRDCRRIAELVGIKTFTNEFIAYAQLEKLLKNRKTWLNYTSQFDVGNPGIVDYVGDDIKLLEWNITLFKGYLSTRSEVIATYALCGFSNFGSMGILLGGLSAMAPHRKQDMAAIILRAMIAGNVACFFTACIAGLFFEDFE